MADVDYGRPLRPGRDPRRRRQPWSGTGPTCRARRPAPRSPSRSPTSAGAGSRHDPARPPGRGRRAERRRRLRRRGAAAEPPHGRGLPRERLPGRDLLDSGRDRGRAADRRSPREAIERFEERDRLAAEAAVRRFLEPRSVAVDRRLAAARHGRRRGLPQPARIATSSGVVYPVNPASDVVQSVRAYPSIAAIPGEVDLAVIAVPAAAVVDAARECARARVSSAGRALRRLRRGRRGRGRARARAGRDLPRRRACGWSARTASACSTPSRGAASTRPLLPRRLRRATSASSPRAAPSASP